MCEALVDYEVCVSIGGRLITNFHFADDIVVNAEEEEEAGIQVLQPQAEEIITGEQAGFRARTSTTEQIFNLRILCEKYL